MVTAHREAVLKDFELAESALISNARCLTEGVDVPAVDMVAFMSPKLCVSCADYRLDGRMALPHLYKYLDVQGAKLTLGNGTFIAMPLLGRYALYNTL